MNMQDLASNQPFLMLLALILIRDVVVPLLKKAGNTIEQDIKDIKGDVGEMKVDIAVLKTQSKERKK